MKPLGTTEGVATLRRGDKCHGTRVKASNCNLQFSSAQSETLVIKGGRDGWDGKINCGWRGGGDATVYFGINWACNENCKPFVRRKAQEFRGGYGFLLFFLVGFSVWWF